LILAPLLQGAVKRLKRGGSLQIVVGTIKGGENILKIIEGAFNRWEVIAGAIQSLQSRTLRVLSLIKREINMSI